MPKHRTVLFVTDEEERVLELATLAMKYIGFNGVEQGLLRLVQTATQRSTPTHTGHTDRPTSKPTTQPANPTVRNGPWLPTPDPRTPTAPQGD